MKVWICALILCLFAVRSVAAEGGTAGAAGEAIVAIPAKGDVESAKIEAKAAAKSEADIPVVLEKPGTASEGGGTLFRVLFGFAVLGILGIGAYVFFRKYSRPGPKKNAPQIKILTQHWMGPKKSLAIVRVAGESILVGITDHNISMIKSLALLDEEIPEETPGQFAQVLGGLGLKNQEIDDTPAARKAAKAGDDEDDFVLGGVRDVVTRRLKGLKEF